MERQAQNPGPSQVGPSCSSLAWHALFTAVPAALSPLLAGRGPPGGGAGRAPGEPLPPQGTHPLVLADGPELADDVRGLDGGPRHLHLARQHGALCTDDGHGLATVHVGPARGPPDRGQRPQRRSAHAVGAAPRALLQQVLHLVLVLQTRQPAVRAKLVRGQQASLDQGADLRRRGENRGLRLLTKIPSAHVEVPPFPPLGPHAGPRMPPAGPTSSGVLFRDLATSLTKVCSTPSSKAIICSRCASARRQVWWAGDSRRAPAACCTGFAGADHNSTAAQSISREAQPPRCPAQVHVHTSAHVPLPPSLAHRPCSWGGTPPSSPAHPPSKRGPLARHVLAQELVACRLVLADATDLGLDAQLAVRRARGGESGKETGPGLWATSSGLPGGGLTRPPATTAGPHSGPNNHLPPFPRLQQAPRRLPSPSRPNPPPHTQAHLVECAAQEQAGNRKPADEEQGGGRAVDLLKRRGQIVLLLRGPFHVGDAELARLAKVLHVPSKLLLPRVGFG